MAYPVLTINQGRERALNNRHPWVFSGAVASIDACQSGDVVEVKSAEGKRFGYGFYHAESPLRCRMAAWSELPLVLDDAFWARKLQQAIHLRENALDRTQTTGYRLINAEGDGWPGLVVDVYGTLAVLQARTPGTLRQVEMVTELLKKEGFTQVMAHGPEGLINGADAPEQVPFLEHGLTFHADPLHGQKTGYFLDQRANRRAVAFWARGKSVLDVFAYAGGFSVHALAAGAKQAIAVDGSAKALELAHQNAAANGLADRFTAEKADAFTYLRELPAGRNELIVLDPPAFTKHIKTVNKAARGYKDINLLALQKLPPGGILATFSCSQPVNADLFRKIVFGAAADAGRPVRILQQLHHAPDHPVDIYHPEGDYLKGLILQVE